MSSTQAGEISTLLLCQGGRYNHGLQTTSSNIQEGYRNPISLHGIQLRIHQYRVNILCKPGSNLLIVDWVSQQNHKEGRDGKIPDMKINFSMVNKRVGIKGFLSMQNIQIATHKDDHLQQLKMQITSGWPQKSI